MTGKLTKICATHEESSVEVRRRTVRMLDFRRIGAFWGRSGACLEPVDGQTC
jgi:hypothetical protein